MEDPTKVHMSKVSLDAMRPGGILLCTSQHAPSSLQVTSLLTKVTCQDCLDILKERDDYFAPAPELLRLDEMK